MAESARIQELEGQLQQLHADAMSSLIKGKEIAQRISDENDVLSERIRSLETQIYGSQLEAQRQQKLSVRYMRRIEDQARTILKLQEELNNVRRGHTPSLPPPPNPAALWVPDAAGGAGAREALLSPPPVTAPPPPLSLHVSAAIPAFGISHHPLTASPMTLPPGIMLPGVGTSQPPPAASTAQMPAPWDGSAVAALQTRQMTPSQDDDGANDDENPLSGAWSLWSFKHAL